MATQTSTFFVDAVLFDMDGTLTDSIAAVEAAWGKVADDIGQDREYVIAATHGKRAIDNLSQFKPHIKSHEMDDEVQNFEQTILDFADAYHTHGPGSREGSRRGSFAVSSGPSSGTSTPALTDAGSLPSSTGSSRAGSFNPVTARRPSFLSRLGRQLTMSTLPESWAARFDQSIFDEPLEEEDDEDLSKTQRDTIEAWKLEAAGVDRSVRILPGVKKMIESIPTGHYAVATSGAKTYAYGCMNRVGITPPAVTITADDKRLKNGKPFPDPFLLAARCLGFDASKCLVFEDSPSGIRAGVASGATVVAVCTSHERSKIENCGAHFIVENMEKVVCTPVQRDGRLQLQFTVSH